MRPADNIDKLFKKLRLKSSAQLNERVHSEIARALEKSTETKPAPMEPNVWRIVMKSRVTRFATAAAIIVIAAISILYLDQLITPAYGLQQTVEAVRGIRFLHVIMRGDDERIIDERWIELGPDGFQYRYRQESNFMGESVLIVDDGETGFFYDRNKNTAVLYDPNEGQYRWISNLAEFFEDMAGDSTVTIEENVDYKGQKAHRVHWLKLNQICYIDPETKLPIAVGPHDIFYDEPPEETFVYAIPDGVTVVDKRDGAPAEEQPEWMKQDEVANEQFDQARKALAAGNYVEAAELFSKVVKVQAMRNWAWFWLGRANYELGRYDAAISAYTKVIEMFAKFKTVPHYCHLARGFAYRAMGMEEAASKDFQVALPVMIEALRNAEGAQMFDHADDPLNRGKGLSESERLTGMIERLRDVACEDFGYDPNAGAADTERAVTAWEQWYETTGR